MQYTHKISPKAYRGRKIASFTDVDYFQNGAPVETKVARELANDLEALAANESVVLLMSEMQAFRTELAKAGKVLNGSVVPMLSKDDDGQFWVNVRAYRTPKQTATESVEALLASLK